MKDWVVEEIATADIGDERLNNRLGILLDRLGEKPTLSIPAACNGWSETLAAYRFFDNDSVTLESVLKPHRDAAINRMAEHKVILLIQDTTELDYTGKKERKGLGILTYDHKLGLLLHPTIAITPERLCLGVVDAKIWSRDLEDKGAKAYRKEKPVEDKESKKWLDGYRVANEIARAVPDSMIINICDREGDVYEYFLEAANEETRAQWIVRACQDRGVVGELDERDSRLWACAESAPILGTIEFTLPASHPRKEKKVTQTLRARRLRLRPPFRKGKKLPILEINVVLVKEENPPDGCEPIEWLLLSSLPANTLEEAAKIVEYYLCRWQIEIYNRVLKSGCQIEELQLETTDRLKPCLALYMIIAWRVMYLLMLGRQCPQLPCDALFEESEWKSVYMIVKKQPPPQQPPALSEMVAIIATLGGYINRNKDGPPGPKAMWIGLQRMHDFAIAWKNFGPGT